MENFSTNTMFFKLPFVGRTCGNKLVIRIREENLHRFTRSGSQF